MDHERSEVLVKTLEGMFAFQISGKDKKDLSRARRYSGWDYLYSFRRYPRKCRNVFCMHVWRGRLYTLTERIPNEQPSLLTCK